TPSRVHVVRRWRRRPEVTGSARAIGRLAWGFRVRVRAAAESMAIRTEAQRRVAVLHAEADALAARRTRELLELGEAAYRQDDEETERGRERVRALDEEIVAKQAEMEAVAAAAEERMRQTRLQ